MAERREEEAGEARLRGQEQANLEEMRGMEGERTRLQAGQVREEVERGRKENGLLRDHLSDLSERTLKTQSYLRSLMREESNLTETLSQLEDENAGLDASISELDTAISINQGAIANKEKDCQEWQFHISSKELEKRKIENEIREKVKQLSAEKERWRTICGQIEQAKSEAARFDSMIGDSSAEINFILAKNNEIKEVNSQLNDDLAVCHRHLENLTRVNRSLEGEVGTLHATNLKAIVRLRQPFANRTNGESSGEKWGGDKWGVASRATNFETGEFESWRNA
jgi:chromosome segregation ATPase